jgi:hypothetical protein
MTSQFIYRDKRYYKIYKMIHVSLFDRVLFSRDTVLKNIYVKPRLHLEVFFQQGIAAKTIESYDSINGNKILENFVATSFFQRSCIKEVVLDNAEHKKDVIRKTTLVASSTFKVFAIFYNLRHYYLRVIMQKNLAFTQVILNYGKPGLNFHFKDMYGFVKYVIS